VIGPVFAAEVRSAAPVLAGAGIPMLSFSSDPSVAAPGVYVMGFLVDDQVTRILSQASAAGLRSMAALVPDSPYGILSEATLRQGATRFGVRLAQVERYQPADLAAKARAFAANAGQIDSLFVPEGPGVAGQVASTLRSAGVDLRRVRMLGSGQWNDPQVYADPALAGAWFPAPDIQSFGSFASRYRGTYGSEPQLTATLAYDAVVLAAGLVRAAGPQRFQPQVLSSPEGFLSSVNGLFRFNSNGTNDRGLAVYEVTGSTPRLIQPAPRSFTGT
jgi:ABC-type branched-subunit amino acid transport system substrate-binding protein